MTVRTQRRTVVFNHPFELKGIDRALPPGNYEVVTDEELIEGLSFAVYRRASTAIIVPGQSHQASSVEMVVIVTSPRQETARRDAPQGSAKVGRAIKATAIQRAQYGAPE